MKWCNPCALMWTCILAALASKMWLGFGWSYFLAVIPVAGVTILVFVHQQSEDVWWTLQNLIADIWWMLKNRHPMERRVPSVISAREDLK